MLEIEEDRIIVPKGIRYISNWKDYNLSDFNFPHILDKKIPGCGYTEYCITSNLNVILCSPRKILLENKEEQHPDTVFYFKNELEDNIEVDKDITKDGKSEAEIAEEKLEEKKRELQRRLEEMTQKLNDYISRCIYNDIPAKVLVTYDSFRLVKKLLIDRGVFDTFYVVIDEMQSVFSDALFKSDTELSFVDQLQGLQRVCYVSATPMLKKYLAMLDEFKDLPYYELDWKRRDPLRVVTPDLKARVTQSIVGTAERIIRTYKKGDFKEMDTMIDGRIVTVQSKEAVIYVNSVKNICDIIKKTELTPDECNILCANTTRNQTRIKKRLGVGFNIGKVPLKGQPHKMFTFCTRTVYLDADFYSTCARSFILSDANIKTLVVDITLDLPQILGRQRLECNPWRNRAEVYFRLVAKNESTEHGQEQLTSKEEETARLLDVYNSSDEKTKKSLIKKFQKDYSNYKDDYVAINTDKDGNQTLVYNNLVRINDMMGWELLQKNYKNLYRMLTSLLGVDGAEAGDILKKINDIPYFHDKMQYIYELNMPNELAKIVLDNIGDVDFSKYYWTIPADRAKALKYRKGNLETEYNSIKGIKSLNSIIYDRFEIGQKYSKSSAKSLLQEIYDNSGVSRTAKASDLSDYFEMRECKVLNKETGKRDAGFEILKRRG